jgi:hypothetical protein
MSEREVDVVITDGFNQHDQMCGGDDVSVAREGEADQFQAFILPLPFT